MAPRWRTRSSSCCSSCSPGPVSGAFGRAIREIYPLLLLLGLYGELDVLNGSGAVLVHDPLVQRWELAVFGMQVSREWWQREPSRFWSTVLHAAYFSYYFDRRRPRRSTSRCGATWPSLRRFVLVLMTTFVLCYLVFIFFPVAGPYYEFPRPAPGSPTTSSARLVYDTLAKGSSYGAAFPSSHVAATVAAAHLPPRRGCRRLGLAAAGAHGAADRRRGVLPDALRGGRARPAW